MPSSSFRLKALSQVLFLGGASLGLACLMQAEAKAVTASASYNPVLQVDGGSAITQLEITGLAGPVSSVTTTINLTKCDDPISPAGVCEGLAFSYNNEIQLLLTSPGGTTRTMVLGNELSGQEPGATVTWTFDDTAADVVSGSSLVSGTFRPFESFSVFNGEDGNGLWTLTYEDLSGRDPLSINSWSLTVNGDGAKVPGPLSLLGAGTALAFSRRLRRRITASS